MKSKEIFSETSPLKLWSSQETANYLGIAISTLYQLTYKGTGPRCYKVGKYRRFKPLEVLAWLDSNAVARTV
jgi:excisionase family DNA binding protein